MASNIVSSTTPTPPGCGCQPCRIKRVVLEGHLDLEVGLVLARSVALGEAAAGLGAVAEGVFPVGHGSLPENLSLLIRLGPSILMDFA